MWLAHSEQAQFGLSLIAMLATAAILMASLHRQFQYFRTQNLPALLCSLLSLCAILYLSSLIPGVLGLLHWPYEYGLLVSINVLFIWLLPRLTKIYYSSSSTPWNLSLNFTQIALSLVGLILCAPLLNYAKDLPWQIINPNGILAWDVVSYHLPGLIEFTQQKSLWSVDGPYQSYGFAYELIAAFFSQGFYTHWGWLLAHWLTITIFILAITSICQSITNTLTESDRHTAIPITLLAIGLVCVMESSPFGALGKNDLFMTTMILSALALLMLYQPSQAKPNHNNLVLILTSVCGGLAVATKPSALGFAILIPFCLGVMGWQYTKKGTQAIRVAAISTLLIFTIGGFWLTRNYILFQAISPVLEGGWRLAVISNLTNPDLYRLRFQTLYIAISLLAFPICIVLLACSKSRSKMLSTWWLIAAFHICAMITLLITPFMIQSGGWELRLAMPLLVTSALIWSTALVQASSWIKSTFKPLTMCRLLAVLMLSLLTVISLTWSFLRTPPLSGYDQVGALPKTQIYQWVWNQEVPLRIYSAGLRPYGLYGKYWQHHLFYDLHSAELNDLAYGKARLASVVQTFAPEVILISIDPLQTQTQPSKPSITTWMDSQTQLFEPIYTDAVVSGYRLLPPAYSQLREYLQQNTPARMGG